MDIPGARTLCIKPYLRDAVHQGPPAWLQNKFLSSLENFAEKLGKSLIHMSNLLFLELQTSFLLLLSIFYSKKTLKLRTKIHWNTARAEISMQSAMHFCSYQAELIRKTQSQLDIMAIPKAFNTHARQLSKMNNGPLP